jgi:hypothetical protein
MVGAMITGQLPAERSSAWPDYLFQIVAYEIDVDKMVNMCIESPYTTHDEFRTICCATVTTLACPVAFSTID